MFSKLYSLLLVAGVLSLSACFVRADEGVAPNQPRRCYSCEGINCQRTSKLNVSTTCSDLLDICVTVFEDFTVVAKGCYMDLPDSHRAKCDVNNNPECFKCFGQMCNNRGRADFKCIECDGADNSDCLTDTSGMTPTQCPVPTAPNSYCYVRTVDGTIRRGCFTEVAKQLDCLNDSECSMCLSNDAEACNSYEVILTSGADLTRLTIIYITLLLAIFK